ncbi:DUF4230 domain-containing protein [Actinoplanes italicus]|nr:DUF4230 domain-containing protein [Actinoplanes italicus]
MAESPTPDHPTSEYPAVPDRPEDSEPTPEQVRPSGCARLLIFVGFVFALIVLTCFGLRAVNVLPSFDNPFAEETTDRSQPVLLQSMRDLHRYVAADGTFQVIVDLQENRDNIPDFLVNRRTLFVGSGTVETYVDFSALSGDALKIDEEKKTIELTLPAPQHSTAALDMQRSYVVAEERGLFNRIGDAFANDPAKQQKVYQMAQERITEAARASGLDQRARDNTQRMLESLFARLGYTTVTVTFAAP